MLVSQFSSVAQPCLTLCEPMDFSTSGFPVHHQLLDFTQTHVHRVSDAIQPFHPLSFPCPPASIFPSIMVFFQWISSSYQIAKVLWLSSSATVLPVNFQNWLPLGLTDLTLQSKGLSRIFNDTTVCTLRWHRGMVRGGRGVQDWEHVYTCGRYMLMYGKTNTIL